MIVCLTLHNSEHVHQMFRCYPQQLYGLALPYAADCTYSGILAQGEDLFLCAHGSPQDIGHPEGTPRFSPGELADWLLHSVLPCHYVGRLHIAAPGALSGYIDDLLDHLGEDYVGRVRGVFHLAYNQIPSTSSNDWLVAIPGAIRKPREQHPISARPGANTGIFMPSLNENWQPTPRQDR